MLLTFIFTTLFVSLFTLFVLPPIYLRGIKNISLLSSAIVLFSSLLLLLELIVIITTFQMWLHILLIRY